MFKRISFIIIIITLLTISCSIVSATEDNNTLDIYDNQNTIIEREAIESTTDYNTDNEIEYDSDASIKKDVSKTNTSTLKKSSKQNTVTLSVTVKNTTVKLETPGNEIILNKNITPVNNKPVASKLGVDYAYADDNGVYTILGSEIRRVMQLDSYCQQIYGYVPKYTYFTAVGSNTKYIISREKWNVIARTLNSYHVNKGYTAVDTPYSITVNLTGKSRYYNVYYDAQEWINGHQYTCGPTAMSMISQALNSYSSERRLAGIYGTTASDGTDESAIIKYSPNVYMKLTDIADNKQSVKNTLNSGKMVFWHIRGHYMCIIGYNSKTDKFLCLNPSGPSHNINAVQWASWNEVTNTDRGLKEHGFMAVSPYRNLSTTNLTHAKYYYYNMGGKYTTPNNNEYCNSNDNKVTVTVNAPSNKPTTANITTLIIKTQANDIKNLVKNKDVTYYINGAKIGKATFSNGVSTLNYRLPAYTPSKITVNAYNNDLVNKQKINLSVSFNKIPSGKSYSKSTTVYTGESVVPIDIIAKKDDKVTLTAYVFDKNGNKATGGKIFFKINGLTVTRNNKTVTANVKNGIGQISYTIPDYGAKNYKLTAIYINNNKRLQGNSLLKIVKMPTKITNTKLSENNGKLTITAKILDTNGNKLVRNTKITIKVDSKTVINKQKVSGGNIKMTLDLSRFKTGTHTLSILAGENEVYKFTSLNTSFYRTNNNHMLIPTYLKSLKTNTANKKLRITGLLVDNLGKTLKGDMKLTVKVNGRTVLAASKVSNGKIDKTINLSGYTAGQYTLTLMTGTTKHYYSMKSNTLIKIS